MPEYQTLIIAGAVGAGISIVAVLIAMRVARRFGLVSRPGGDRWSKKETPLLGGAAVLAGFMVSFFIFGKPDGENVRIFYILAASGFLFLLGLVDDIRGLGPNIKLIGQAAAACLLIYGGVYVNIWFPTIGIPLSIIWFVGMSNAVNLLDNMDGVASGVCAISAGVLAFHAASSGYSQIALAAAALCGSCAGFTFFNFHPAKIFMGDCGSLFLGMTLGALGVTATYREAGNVLVTLLVPVMVLAVPLFDMFFVSVLRKGHGRSITTGGRDHTAHRLVSLGLSERRAAVLFYAVCLTLGLASTAARMSFLVMLLVAGFAGAGLLIGAFLLGKVKVYTESEEPQKHALTMRLFRRYRRTVGLALFDILVISASFIAAYFIRFDWHIPEFLREKIPEALPVIVVIKLLAFMFFRLYSVEWEKVGRREVGKLFMAVSAGSAVSIAAVGIAYRFVDFSRSVFIIDWLLCMVLLGGLRLVLPVLVKPEDKEEVSK